jgi:V/A-type H+-transporting ATPase subunit D
MIHPNRTYLLQLKEKRSTVSGSLAILKARRQALLFEFLASVRPFLRSRRQLRELFALALHELRRAKGDEGEETIASLALVNIREDELVIEKKNILGVSYFDVVMPEGVRRAVDERHYDYAAASPHLEEAADRLEAVVEAMLSLAAFEIKVRRLGEEILRISRRARVLEERILPVLAEKIRSTDLYIGEREREEYFRLKKFKNLHG